MKKVWIILVIFGVIIIMVAGVAIFIKTRPQELVRDELKLHQQELERFKYESEVETVMENKNYVENQVLAVADSKREAKKIAKQIGGELLSYENQVAVIQIGITVEEMMQKLEEDATLPRVYPNYQNYSN